MIEREKGGEERRFREAFAAVLARDPDTPPGPTAINMELRKHESDTYHTPLNVLNGRMSALRTQLLKEAGFVQTEKWARWHKP
jgi:hypothetical protein